jgi:hypothetical protein
LLLILLLQPAQAVSVSVMVSQWLAGDAAAAAAKQLQLENSSD